MVEITAQLITNLLAEKHSKDVFVPECKDGPSQFVDGSLRIDAWTMNRSWANACVTAYEIKISRSDFLADQKWHRYLPYCNAFYFVAPHGMIGRDELPKEAGLLQVAKTGTRLFTKKKAPRRDVQIPEELYRYILMSRVKIKGEVEEHGRGRVDAFQSFLEDKRHKKRIGHLVGGAVGEHCRRLKTENDQLRRRMGVYARVRRQLKELGIDPEAPDYEIRRDIDRLRGEIPPWLPRYIERGKTALQAIEELLKGHN